MVETRTLPVDEECLWCRRPSLEMWKRTRSITSERRPPLVWYDEESISVSKSCSRRSFLFSIQWSCVRFWYWTRIVRRCSLWLSSLISRSGDKKNNEEKPSQDWDLSREIFAVSEGGSPRAGRSNKMAAAMGTRIRNNWIIGWHARLLMHTHTHTHTHTRARAYIHTHTKSYICVRVHRSCRYPSSTISRYRLALRYCVCSTDSWREAKPIIFRDKTFRS